MRFTRVLVAAALALAVLGACSSDDEVASSSSDETGNGADGEPIIIGMVLPTTGPAATLGEFQARGVRLAVEDINANGGIDGRPVELVERDDQGDPERAVAETNTLRDRGVHAIVGSGITGTCYAMEPVVRESELPTYCLSGAIPPDDNEYMFFALPPLDAFGTAHVGWMHEQGHTTMAHLHSTDATGMLNGEVVPKFTEEGGIEVVGQEQFDVEAQDVTAQLTNLRRADPDVLYIGSTGGPTATVLRGLRDIGWDVPVVLTWSNATDAFVETVAPVLPAETYIGGTGIYVSGQEGSDTYRRFLELYGDSYEEGPEMYSASGYDAVQILARAVAATDGSGPAVRGHMIDGMGAYEGVNGTIDFTEDDLRGMSDESVVLLRVTEDGYELAGA